MGLSWAAKVPEAGLALHIVTLSSFREVKKKALKNILNDGLHDTYFEIKRSEKSVKKRWVDIWQKRSEKSQPKTERD